MKIVLTNDDGFGKPGLSALIEATRKIGQQVVVAPEEPCSNIGHRVTTRTSIEVDEREEGRFVVNGTPADCTRLALKELAPDADWVIAGINPGANLGSDVYQSGTVAAAREAAILGVKGVAVSHYIAPGRTINWQEASLVTAEILKKILSKEMARGQYVNINLPSPLSLQVAGEYISCPLDTHPHRYDFVEASGTYQYRGIIHDRPRTPGSDVDVCFSGSISVSDLTL